MSAMSAQKRKIAIIYNDRMAIIRAAFKPEEYLKHRVHRKKLERFENEEAARLEHKQLLAAVDLQVSV
jgi:hypothetical protein